MALTKGFGRGTFSSSVWGAGFSLVVGGLSAAFAIGDETAVSQPPVLAPGLSMTVSLRETSLWSELLELQGNSYSIVSTPAAPTYAEVDTGSAPTWTEVAEG